MAVNLSPVGGVAAQFFDNSGNVLTGGKIYTYLAGTTTPATTYTSSNGATAWSNPIVLDASGRVSGSGEIWLTDSIVYKFVLKDSNDVLIATYDNITGINSNFVNFVSETEIQTATAGQTVFTLTTIEYQPGTNNLLVFVDGVNQYEGSTYSFVETNSTTVTFVSGLHVGAEVKFTTATPINTLTADAATTSYLADFSGAVSESVADKLDQLVSVKDFGATGDGATDDTDAIRTAFAASNNIYFPPGIYIVDGTDTGTLLTLDSNNVNIYGDGYTTTRIQAKTNSDGFYWIKGDGSALANVNISGLWFYGNNTNRGTGEDYIIWLNNIENTTVHNCRFEAALSQTTLSKAILVSDGSKDCMIANNSFASNGGEDINFYGSNGSVYRCSAIGNVHYQPQGPCIEIEGRNGTTISGYQVYDVNIIGNTIRSDGAYSGAGDHGILCIGGFNVNISDNIIDRRGTNGMLFIGSTNVVVANNVIRDMGASGYNGISVSQESFGANGVAINFTIDGNVIDSCENCAINLFGGETITATVQNFTVSNNICTNVKTGINATGIQNYASSGNSFRSCSVNNYFIDALTGAVAVIDAGNQSGTASYPAAMSQKNINHSSGSTLTLDLSNGNNIFNVNLTSNVTAINVTGTPALGQKLAILFLQSGSGATVTTTQANWTTNSTANFQFPALTVPTLPGSATNGRWGYIEFVYGQNTVSPNKWVMTTSQANCG